MSPSKSKQETVTVTDIVVAVTDKALLLKKLSLEGGGQQSWLAKSLIVESDTDLQDIQADHEITVEIPRWLAEREGLED